MLMSYVVELRFRWYYIPSEILSVNLTSGIRVDC